ncbi:MAG: DUF58 domain-containing protein [Bacillota bacterium]
MNRHTILWAFFVILLTIGVLTETPAVTFMTLAVSLTLVAGHLWARSAVAHLTYRHRAAADRCLTGETLELQVEMDNPTFLPLPWVELTDFVPQKGFHLGTPGESSRGSLIIRTGMAWFQRMRRTYRVTLTARGYYPVGPSTIRVWDPLGLTFAEKGTWDRLHFLVYPITVPLRELDIASDHPFGDPERQRWLFRDPFSVAGARPYEPGDPLRFVHWPATATAGELMTRQMEGIRSPDLLIFLNLRTMVTAWHGTVPELLELSITAAASIARHAADSGYRVGLYANGNLQKESREESAPLLQVPPSSHPRQLRRILSALARTAPHGSTPLERTLRLHARGDLCNSAVVVISAVITEDLRSQLGRMVRQGQSVTLVYSGDDHAPNIPGVPCYNLGGSGRWAEIAARWGHSTE